MCACGWSFKYDLSKKHTPLHSGKLPAATQVLYFQTACQMMPHRCVIAGQVSTKNNSILLTPWILNHPSKFWFSYILTFLNWVWSKLVPTLIFFCLFRFIKQQLHLRFWTFFLHYFPHRIRLTLDLDVEICAENGNTLKYSAVISAPSWLLP